MADTSPDPSAGPAASEAGAAPIGAEVVPKLPRGVRLRFDKQRESWILLAPERVLKLDQISKAILERVDGERTFAAIIDDLAATFQADRTVIERDVTALMRDLADKRYLEL